MTRQKLKLWRLAEKIKGKKSKKKKKNVVTYKKQGGSGENTTIWGAKMGDDETSSLS